MASRRQLRIAEQLREELADIIAHDLSDPRLHFITVTRVDVSGDLKYADVYVSVLGSDEEEAESLEALQHANAYIRTLIAQRLPLRRVPELRFQVDVALENTMRIWELLEEIDDESEDTGHEVG